MIWTWILSKLANWKVWVFAALVLFVIGGWSYWAYFTNKIAKVEAEKVALANRAEQAEKELLLGQKAFDELQKEKDRLDKLMAEREATRIKLATEVTKLKTKIKELQDEKSRQWLESEVPDPVLQSLPSGVLAVP